jgi:hypothetical protein
LKAKLRLYSPHPKQLEFHQSTNRFRVVSFGRQAGKSTACNNELLKRAWEKPNSTLWFVSPTYDSARIMFRRACAALNGCREIFTDNKSELLIELINGSKIFYKSGEVFENLRSETLDGVVLDEVRNQKPELWSLVIRPMLTTTKGWAVFISTPNGFDHFYDLAQYAIADKTNDWLYLQAPSTCNPLITAEELENAKKTMSEAQFAQEYLAEFRDLTSGKAYIQHGPWNHSEVNPFWADGPVHPNLPICVAMDFNLSPMAWTLGQKKANKFHFFDEINLKGSHTQEAAEVLAQKILIHKPKFGVIICGDSSSKAGQRAAAGQSDYDIVCQTLDRHGIRWVNETPEANPHVKDRVNTMNAKLKDATGEVSITYSPTACPNLKKDFDRVVWKPGAGDRIILDQTTNPELTHQSDGVGYLVCALSPLGYNAEVPTLRVVRR